EQGGIGVLFRHHPGAARRQGGDPAGRRRRASLARIAPLGGRFPHARGRARPVAPGGPAHSQHARRLGDSRRRDRGLAAGGGRERGRPHPSGAGRNDRAHCGRLARGVRRGAGEKSGFQRGDRFFGYSPSLCRGRFPRLKRNPMLDLTARLEKAQETAASSAASAAHEPHGLGLAGRVLVVTLGFVLLAMGLFYVTRLAAFRETWLHNKLASAQTAFEAFDGNGADELPPNLSNKILASVGVKSIAVSTPSGWRVLVEHGMRGESLASVETVNLDSETFVDSIGAAFETLFAKPGAVIHVSDGASPGEAGIAVTLDETPLQAALWRVSRTFLNIALMIAAVVTCVLWAALWQMVLRPVRRLTSNIIAFGERPQDVSRVIAPRGRHDEIGRAETAL